MNVSGDSRDVNDAKKHIEDMLSRSRSQSNSRNTDQRDRGRGNNDGERIEIYSDKVGTIIGRGGCMIRELQENHGVRINVDKNPNHNGMVSVSVSGDNVQEAISKIKELVGDVPQKVEQSVQEPMEEEFVQIDWQGAARESVRIVLFLYKLFNASLLRIDLILPIILGRSKS